MREQILDLARKRFHAVKRKSGLKKAKFKVSSLAHLLNKVKDFTDEDDDDGSGDNEDEGDGDGESLGKRQKGEMSSIQREAQEYLVGFTMVPPNVMGERLDDFAPVRSWDMCGKRKRASGVCSALFLRVMHFCQRATRFCQRLSGCFRTRWHRLASAREAVPLILDHLPLVQLQPAVGSPGPRPSSRIYICARNVAT